MNVPGEVFLGQIRIDGTVLAFTAAISLFAGLLFGLLPAIRASRQESQDVLRQTTRGATAARGFRFLRNVLVAGEVALAVILSVGAALLLDTVANLQRVESGFQPNGVLTMSLELPTDTKYRTQATQSEFYRQMMAAILSKPGILSAGVTETVPLDREDRATRFRVAEKPEPAQGQSPFADYNPANAGYFETMRIPLVKGRMFNEQDDLSHPRVVVIDTTMANTYFPNEDPIGKHIIAWNGSHEIVGVVGAVRRAGLDREPTPTFYTSYLQSPDNQMVISVRSRLSNEQTVRAVKEAVWTVDKDQPLYQIRTMDEVVSQASSIQRTTTILLGAFALVALVLAAVGVYGVISYVVSQRTQEIGVRRALGAQTDSILWLVVGEGLKVAAFGVAAGVAGSLLLQRGLATLLYGVAGAEMWLLGAVSLLILLVASVASLMPARRAIQLDPMNALRYE
jgi:putative ABC transport system permease protein